MIVHAGNKVLKIMFSEDIIDLDFTEHAFYHLAGDDIGDIDKDFCSLSPPLDVKISLVKLTPLLSRNEQRARPTFFAWARA
jgi:hypothetical protein